jgi:putative polyketide hydroxylase
VYINISRGPIAEVRANKGTEEDYRRKWEDLTPVYPRKIPASDYEAALYRQASQWPTVDIEFSSRILPFIRYRSEVFGLVRQQASRHRAMAL